MNIYVLLFFIHNVIATFIIGGKFVTLKDKVFKYFGLGLLLDGIAFAIWSLAILLRPENLELYVTTGVFFFILSLVSFLAAGVDDRFNTKVVVVLGILVGAIIFYLRTFVFISDASFSEQGLFFFNPHPFVAMLYIFGLTLAGIPAIEALSSKFSSLKIKSIVKYGFIIELVGGIILITSTNSSTASHDVLYVTGWIIGLVYLVMWSTLLFNKRYS